MQDRENDLKKAKPIATATSSDSDVSLIEPRNSNMQLIDYEGNNEQSFPSASYNKSQQQTQINFDQVLAVEENNEALRGLEKDIVDVNSIFKDLAILVHDQGEVIGTLIY